MLFHKLWDIVIFSYQIPHNNVKCNTGHMYCMGPVAYCVAQCILVRTGPIVKSRFFLPSRNNVMIHLCIVCYSISEIIKKHESNTKTLKHQTMKYVGNKIRPYICVVIAQLNKL